MGVCSSCLGFGRRHSQSDPSESSHLLVDPYQPQYGSINPNVPHGLPQLDPEEVRRQRDALERICAQTSDKLIDVAQSTYADESSKMTSEYPRLFNELFATIRPAAGSRPSSSSTHAEEDEESWLARIAGVEVGEEGPWARVEPGAGPLTVRFDRAFALDRKPSGDEQ